jgi:hypothetical protein
MTTIVPEMSSGVSPMRSPAATIEEIEIPAPVVHPAPPASAANTQWDMATKRMVLGILLVVGALVLWLCSPVIPMLIIASIFSYLLSPIVDLSERLRIPRSVSTIILFVLLLIGLVLAPILLTPVLADQLNRLTRHGVRLFALGEWALEQPARKFRCSRTARAIGPYDPGMGG